MKLIFRLLFGTLFLAMGCLPKQNLPTKNTGGGQKTTESPSVPSSSVPSSRPSYGTSAAGLSYIDRYQKIAIEEMQKHGIPASIKLAQGLLESGNGTSKLAVEFKNHFGIKCTNEWRGNRTYHDDDDLNECFRVYQNPEDSFRDHSAFLLRKRYESLFLLDRTDYKGWAKGLKAAGYATNPRYADLLVDLIERYELYQFDSPIKTPTHQTPNPQTPNPQTPNPLNRGSAASSKKAMQIHEVRAGETADMLAEKFSVTLEQLKNWNQLKTLDLQPGQLLIVSK